MSTRSSTRNLFPPLNNPELTIRKRPRVDPTLLNGFEMATNRNGNDVPPPEGGDLPVPDLRTMEELCQPTLNGRGRPIAPIEIQAMNFRLKNDITHHATAWFDRLPRNFINTFEKMAKMFLGKYFPPSMVTKLRNEITNFHQRPDESLFEAWEHYKLSIDHCPNHNMLLVTQIDTFYNGLTLRHRDTINAAASGTFMKRRPEECYDLNENMTAHHNDWDTFVQKSESSSSITSTYDPKIVALKAEMAEISKNLMKVLQINQQVKAVAHNFETYGGPHSYNDCPATVGQTQNVYATGAYNQGGLGTLTSNTITNLKEDLKGITTRSGNTYKGPTIPTTSSLSKVVEHEIEVTKDMVPPTNNESTKDIQPLVVQVETLIPNSEPVVLPLYDQKLHDKNNDQKEKFFKIFKDLDFNISFVDALILMPKFGPTIKSLLTNKKKLFELARTPLNEHCSTVLLKKLLEKLGDPGKFLIPCDFSGMDECLALADLGASINLMSLSVWNKLSLPNLSPTCMTLKLVDRSISCPIGVSIDVYIKTGRALIDVYEGELTLRVGKEAVTFNIDQTSRYSSNYDAMSVNQIDLINVACEDDFLLEETDAFLVINDEPVSPKIDNSYYDLEGYILLLKEFINDDLSSPPLPLQELKTVEPNKEKSSIHEPPVVELKDLPPHLKYAFLEGDDKLLVIIAKDLKDEEKTTLIKVLKSHKQALAWQLFNIKGGFTIVENEENELIPTRLVTSWRVCIDYRKLNDTTRKDHFPLPFMEQMLKILAGNEYYCFLDGFSGYFQIPIDPQDQEKTTSCVLIECLPTVACLLAYAMHWARSKVFGNSFETCLSHLDNMLKGCEDTNICLNWEKSHFMVKKGIVLGHKISKNRIEVDTDKVDVIAKLPHPTAVKGIRSFLGYAGFYRRFIQDFLKRAWPMTRLLEKDTPFFFSKECIEVFQTLKKKLTEAPILVAPDWDLPFKLMCDTSDFSIGAVLVQQKTKHFQLIHYASKTMTDVQAHYTTTEKELLAVVYAFEKFRPYLFLSKIIVYTDHSALKCLFNKQDAKPRLLRWVLLLQEFDFMVRDKKGAENLAADHLS
nr:DNA-directed DNA polymerase [Tanacetum cinerariifolium]